MTFKAKVEVMPQKEILDPQGKAVEHAMQQLGFAGTSQVRVGKLVEFQVEAPDVKAAGQKAEEAARKLLANLIMEDYAITILEN